MVSHTIIIWLAALAFFVILELATIQLVAVWFCAGAIGGLIGAIFEVPVEWQIAAFLIISLLLVIFTRPIAQKFLLPKIVKTNYNRFIGMEYIVYEDIDNYKNIGAVKISGVVWSAKSNDNSIIKKGSLIKVLDIKGAKLIVENIHNNREES